jgi:uncharacterized membrane protein YcaP (DUF421 family)
MEITFASILLRVSVMYLVALILIRLSGKQTISELSTMDFVVANILGDAFDTVIFSEVTILQGVVYFVTVTALHFITRLLSSRSKFFYRLFASQPRTMIQQGLLVPESLAAERTRVETVFSDMRLKKVERLEEVREAVLEENGQLSVLKQPASKDARKQDLRLLTK